MYFAPKASPVSWTRRRLVPAALVQAGFVVDGVLWRAEAGGGMQSFYCRRWMA